MWANPQGPQGGNVGTVIEYNRGRNRSSKEVAYKAYQPSLAKGAKWNYTNNERNIYLTNYSRRGKKAKLVLPNKNRRLRNVRALRFPQYFLGRGLYGQLSRAVLTQLIRAVRTHRFVQFNGFTPIKKGVRTVLRDPKKYGVGTLKKNKTKQKRAGGANASTKKKNSS